MTSARVSDPAQIEPAIETAARVPKVGMMVLAGSFVHVHRNLIVTLAARHRLPAVYVLRDFVAAGGLLSYGVKMGRAYPKLSTVKITVTRY